MEQSEWLPEGWRIRKINSLWLLEKKVNSAWESTQIYVTDPDDKKGILEDIKLLEEDE